MTILNLILAFFILTLFFSCSSLEHHPVKAQGHSKSFPMTSSDRWSQVQ